MPAPKQPALFTKRFHEGLEVSGLADLIRAQGKTPAHFIPELLLAYVGPIMDALAQIASLDVQTIYREVVVPTGDSFMKEWGIPPLHRLMCGDGKFWKLWGCVFERVPRKPSA